ncbi:MAG: hypothetical protein LBK02_09580 [Treponema sp.]|nr:hypothetical protein [Treponema sp.]
MNRRGERGLHVPALVFFLAALLFPGASPLEAQGFGFGDDTEAGAPAESAAPPPQTVKIGGEISARLLAYFNDFGTVDKAKWASLGDIFSGALNFNASGGNIEGHIGLKISGRIIADMAAYKPWYTPPCIDEAYLRAFFGPLVIESGYRKLTWGKADSMGPLDVVNPLDYSDLTGFTDLMAIKIARPMVHLSWDFGANTRLAAVFIPVFQGHKFAANPNDRWYPEQAADISNAALHDFIGLIAGDPTLGPIVSTFLPNLPGEISKIIVLPDIPPTGLQYAQAGLRFTTTIGPADFGAQYYYGNFFRPSYRFDRIPALASSLFASLPGIIAGTYSLSTASSYSPIDYNRYHQLGLDYAQVLYGFNIRAEFAAHITDDLGGDKGWMRNPFLAWSFGFDRDLLWGINANIQCSETIRLLNDKVINNPALDMEADTEPTATRLTVQLAKKFLRDDLELKVTNIWDIENMDLYLIPAISWNIKDLTAELSAGFFTGKAGGELSQYHRNNFIKTALKYSF